MGVDQLISDHNRSTTIGELIEIHGEEAVKRGISYMESLSEAEESYRESVNGDRFKRGVENAYGVEEGGERVEEAVSKWEESMRENGLGVTDE